MFASSQAVGPDSSEVWLMHVVQCASYSGLTILVWEFLITLGYEVDYIWVEPNNSPIKWLYLFSRYYGLVGQIGCCIIIAYLNFTSPLTSHTCRVWLLYQMFVVQGLITSLEAILMIRIYALYNRSRRVGIFLLIVLTSKVTITAISGILVLPTFEFDHACFLTRSSNSVLFFCFAELFTQSIIVLLTLTKHTLALHGWGRTPVVSLVIRDGTLVFVVISMLIATMVANTVSQGILTRVPLPMFIVIPSSAGCRLIINMNHLAVSHHRESTGSSRVVLTSVISNP